MSFLDFSFFEKEWPVVSGAPIISTIGILAALTVGYGLAYFLHRRELSFAEGRVKDAETRLAEATGGLSNIKIAIIAPKENAVVPLKATVKGSINSSGHAVQILISPDTRRLWFPQPKPEMNGLNWSAECDFGEDPYTKTGELFRIVALTGCINISEPIADLPKEASISRIVTVRRA